MAITNKEPKEPTQEELNAVNQETAEKQQQMNDPRQGITIDNLQKLQQIQQIEQMSEKRDQQLSHNPDHTQYGVSAGEEQTIIGREQVHKANEILQKYKDGKTNLEKRIIDNEQWWKMRHWEQLNSQEELEYDFKSRGLRKASSAWLFNSMVNKHADIMDNYPEAAVLPREQSDEKTAKILSQVIPVVLEQNDFEQTYNDCGWYKLKTGTGAYGVFWNSQKNNGMGDIDIKKVDLLNMFWEPGITNIQDSENIFYVSIVSNNKLKQAYPDKDLVVSGSPTVQVEKYIYDDAVDTTDMSAVIDWYYKVDVPVETMPGFNTTKTIVHYCKYCNGTVLYASENDPQYRTRGYYDHGLYPFVFDVLFQEEGTPCGFGYIDVMKNCQEYIDRLSNTILENAIVSSKQRAVIRDDGSINEEEFINTDNNIIHANGNLGEDSIRFLQAAPLNGTYVTVLNNKINELKETSGNRDVNQGSTSSGVTAASAIAALQEAGSKGSRDINKASFRAFTKIVHLVIELMRQFYEEPRYFRITGDTSTTIDYAEFDNRSMIPQQQGEEFGIDLGSRLPIFDVDVVPAKKSAYSKMSENELAIQFYNLGFFAPNNADQSLACLSMMDFDGKQAVIDKISQNQTMFQTIQALQQQVLQLAAVVDHDHGTNMAQQMMGVAQGTQAQMSGVQANGKATHMSEGKGSQAEKATANAQNVAAPK